ncbi:MAG: hypothetical protein HOH36_08135 [Acidimicrobiaceae bacterium]|nr:hypothetical protein [Acidimicrobiaceae bacterium]MBT5850386.1 hypothetical protein [Acidimicrobiaceae bacterium]MDG1410426.1 hypothetical protein [Acidimicrobiales bacterium]MDG2217970.1 hypothetical protein [Acidimicrobiales bacterium]
MRSRHPLGWGIALTMITLTFLIEPALAAVAAESTDPDYLDDAGRIIGSPAAGPDPEYPGDRGGYAQFLTLAVMIGGLSFIAWRITRQISRTTN